MVVRLAAEDGHGAIELFNKQQTDHLVAEGHLAEADFGICALVNCFAKAVRPAYDESQAACGSVEPGLQLFGKRQAAILLAMFVQQYNKTAFHSPQYSFAFLLLLLCFAQALGVLKVRNDLNVERNIVLEASDVRLYHLRQFVADRFAHH